MTTISVSAEILSEGDVARDPVRIIILVNVEDDMNELFKKGTVRDERLFYCKCKISMRIKQIPRSIYKYII